jgi:OOP family OmpA-OmpF porin
MNRLFSNNLGLFPVLAAVFFLLASAVLVPSTSLAQQDIKKSLFKDADEALKVAQERQAELYAPKAFLEGMKRYKEAEEDLRKGKNLEDIRKKLKEAEGYFKKAAEATKVAAVVFAAAAAVRSDALNAEVTKYASGSWNKAERKLEEAARTLEAGDAKGAKSKGGEAETLYRMAELEAIKTNYLQRAWSSLQRAEDMDAGDRAPQTLEMAHQMAQKAEAMLAKNRYDADEAIQLAQQAEYEAVHAIYLSETIKRLKAADNTFEDVLLGVEGPLQKIAGTLDLTAQFHQGLDIPTATIAEAIEKLQDEHIQCAQAREKMERQLLQLGSTEEELREEVQWQRIRQEKMDRISASFSRAEGNILLDGENVIIRLYGLSFPVGTSTIEPQYFSLLTKVQNAFAEFPDCKVIIEGHTDSQGSDIANQRLASERAGAVKQYILANTNIPSGRIEAIGYGESRPIASNETRDGRAKNRRIDVVIQPVGK